MSELNERAVWPISQIKVGRRSRKRLGDIAALMESIAAVGLLHPIVVSPNGQLVAGYRRLQALQRLGLTDCEVTVTHTVDDELTALRAEADENACREPWSVADIAAHAMREKPKEQARAKQRQRDGGKAGGQGGGKLPQASSPPKVRDAVAATTGVGGRTLDKIEHVYKAAEQDSTMAPVVAAMEADDKVDSAHKVAQWTAADRGAYAKLWDWGWSNGQVARFRDLIEQLPQGEQTRARALVLSEQTPVPGAYGKKVASNLLLMPASQRERIYDLHASDDERDRTTAVSLAIGNPPPADPRLARLVELARELRRMGKQWPDEKPSQRMATAAETLDAIAEELRQQVRTKHQPAEGAGA